MDASTAGRAVALLAGGTLALAVLVGCAGDGGETTSPGASATTESSESTTSESATSTAAPQELVDFLTAQFEEDDADGDGMLDADEIRASIEGDFADSDLDGDGTLTPADVQAELDAADGGTADQPLSYYLPYDRDDDGTITREEYVQAVTEDVMTPMDTDEDGRVTLEEAIAWHQQAASVGGAP